MVTVVTLCSEQISILIEPWIVDIYCPITLVKAVFLYQLFTAPAVVMVRIGAPRDLNIAEYRGDLVTYKRDLGAYISPRDLTRLFMKAIETSDIDNEYGIPWQIVYGISNNTRAF